MYILLTITVQNFKLKIELQRCEFRDLNLYFMAILTAVLFLKHRLLKIAKSRVFDTYRSDMKKTSGIGRFITNQQNIYRVTPVHYLQKAETKTRERITNTIFFKTIFQTSIIV